MRGIRGVLLLNVTDEPQMEQVPDTASRPNRASICAGEQWGITRDNLSR
jgi:hypothetical protein